MNLEKWIRPELLVLIPVLYLVGIGLKKSHVSDRFIPLLLGVIGVILSALRIFSACIPTSPGEVAAAAFLSVTQGILVAGASVYVNQLYVQSKKKEK